MNKLAKKLLPLTFFLLLSNLLPAIDYNEQAAKIRAAVWAWDKPAFKNYAVPDQYKDESAVVIAHHKHIEAVSKNKFRMNALLMADVNRELYCTQIDRVMVKINSKVALEEYSQLSFKEERKTMGYLRSNKFQNVIGVRVIKPDGTIKEVDVKEDAVSMTEGKKDQEAFKKLAISDLQIGDVVDYFFCQEMELETANIPLQIIAFYSEYPTLSYSVHCEFGRKLTVEYRSINGAPELEVSTDQDGNIIMDVEKKDLLKVGNLDELRWLSPLRSLPMIRLSVLNNSSKLIYKPSSARKSGVYKDVSFDHLFNDAKGYVAAQSTRMLGMGEINKKVNAAIADYKKKVPDASKNELALYIYNVLRFYYPSEYVDYLSDKLIVRLEQLLKQHDIECKLAFTTSRNGARRSELVTAYDLDCMVVANGNTQFFSYSNGYRVAGELPADYQGETASTVAVSSYKIKKEVAIEGATGECQLPTTTAAQNKSGMRMDVSVSADNPLQLIIGRDAVWSGDLKNDIQPFLVLYEDWDKAMRAYLMIDKTLEQELSENKDTRKYVEQYKAIFEKKRQEHKEALKSEIIAFHGIGPEEVLDFSMKNMGILPTAPEMQYEINYRIDGLVKKAGSNLVLEVGKLIGEQWNPNENERNRIIDAYLPTARSFENQIRVQLPEGYELQTVEGLNCKVVNEYGTFEVVASLTDQVLTITTRKIYHKSFVPKTDWNKLLEMIDKANDFYAQSVVLRKKV